MALHLIAAMTHPVEGRDAEYNDWYDNVAIPTYKSIPGLIPLGRFKAADVPPLYPFERKNDFGYLSLYCFETDNPTQFMAELATHFPKRPEYKLSDDIDQSKFFEPIFVAMGDVNFEILDRFDHLKR